MADDTPDPSSARVGAPPPKDEGQDKPKKKGLGQRPLLLVGLIAGAALLVILAIVFFLNARKFQSTDDAFIDTHIVHLAPQVAGRVVRVEAQDNQLVGPGQLLVQIDPVDQNERVAQAQAQRAQAEAQRAQSQAQRDTALAQIATSQQQFRQAQAQVPGAEAQALAAQRDYERYLTLQRINPQAVARQQLDQARAQAAQTASQAAAQRRARDAANAQVAQAATQVKGADATIRGSDAQIAAADAQLASARTNLGYTQLTAPLVGHVANKNVAVGSYVQPGQQLMAIVPTRIWVTANFKETQLKDMRVGQHVDVKVDAYPDYRFHGHVDSFQRGAGQAFAVLPSENATGNFVKVVQRVPVKIVIDNLDDLHHPLGPGMSVEPKVRVLD